jgi:hypothetical protein
MEGTNGLSYFNIKQTHNNALGLPIPDKFLTVGHHAPPGFRRTMVYEGEGPCDN